MGAQAARLTTSRRRASDPIRKTPGALARPLATPAGPAARGIENGVPGLQLAAPSPGLVPIPPMQNHRALLKATARTRGLPRRTFVGFMKREASAGGAALPAR